MLQRRHSEVAAHWTWPGGTAGPQGVRCGNLSFISGQLDLDVAGIVRHPGNLAAQTAAIMGHIARIILGLGGDLSDLVKLSDIYVDDGTNEAGFLAEIARHLPTGRNSVVTAV